MDTDMDLTALDSKMCADARTTLHELKKLIEKEQEMKLELDKIKNSVAKYKSIYECKHKLAEDMVDKIKQYSNSEETRTNREEDNNLKDQIESLQIDLHDKKIYTDEIINYLKVSIAQAEQQEEPPVLLESDDSEILEIMDENVLLKEEKDMLPDAIKKIDMMLLEISQKYSCVTKDLDETQEMTSDTQNECRKNREHFQEEMEKKAMLLSTLSQMNQKPLAVLNKQSLFDEVNEKRSVIMMKYQILKNKYMRMKEFLTKNNAEIKELKDENIKQKYIIGDFASDTQRAEHKFEIYQKQRMEELDMLINMLAEKKKKSMNEKHVLIDGSNFSTVNHFSEIAKAEQKRCNEEIMKVLALKFPLQQNLIDLERDLKNNSKQLKMEINANAELVKEFQQLQNGDMCKSKGNCSHSTLEKSSAPKLKKSIRFAEEVKYHKD